MLNEKNFQLSQLFYILHLDVLSKAFISELNKIV